MTDIALIPIPLTTEIIRHLPHSEYYGTSNRHELLSNWVYSYNDEFVNWLEHNVDHSHWCYGVLVNDCSIMMVGHNDERAYKGYIYIRFDLSQLTLYDIGTLLQPNGQMWPYFKEIENKAYADHNFKRSTHPCIVYDTCYRHWIDFDSKIK